MFETTSRYNALENVTLTTPAGRNTIYKKRRFLPQGENIPLLVEVTVIENDRLDMITARILGDSEQFWRICDANNTMNPFDLTTKPGRVLRIPEPQF